MHAIVSLMLNLESHRNDKRKALCYALLKKGPKIERLCLGFFLFDDNYLQLHITKTIGEIYSTFSKV